MKKLLFIIVSSLICLLPQAAFAWDDVGHKVVSRIAWEKMTPEARKRAIETLSAAPEDSGLAWLLPYDSRSRMTRELNFFELASAWSDIVRDEKSPFRRERYHHGNWHYTNYFWKQVNGLPVDVTELHPAPQNVVERLLFLQKALSDKNTPASEKAIYLAWVLHLVGDIHQPLHCSARVTDTEPKGDQGANLFYLEPKKENSAEPRLNLHWYWDSILRYAYPRRGDECDTDYVNTIAAKIMARYQMSNNQTELKPDQFDEWAQESFKATKTHVYPLTLKRDELPSKTYQQNALEISEQRMALAGYRMAQLLNEIFKQ
jgi:hypothetical protein